MANLEKETEDNQAFRKVLYTDAKTQLVVMSLSPGEEIGEEVHQVDQFLRIESGTGEAVLDGERLKFGDGFGIIVPAGTRHNIINSGSVDLKIYTLYSPPNHRPGTIHQNKAAAEADEGEHFAGL